MNTRDVGVQVNGLEIDEETDPNYVDVVKLDTVDSDGVETVIVSVGSNTEAPLSDSYDSDKDLKLSKPESSKSMGIHSGCVKTLFERKSRGLIFGSEVKEYECVNLISSDEETVKNEEEEEDDDDEEKEKEEEEMEEKLMVKKSKKAKKEKHIKHDEDKNYVMQNGITKMENNIENGLEGCSTGNIKHLEKEKTHVHDKEKRRSKKAKKLTEKIGEIDKDELPVLKPIKTEPQPNSESEEEQYLIMKSKKLKKKKTAKDEEERLSNHSKKIKIEEKSVADEYVDLEQYLKANLQKELSETEGFMETTDEPAIVISDSEEEEIDVVTVPGSDTKNSISNENDSIQTKPKATDFKNTVFSPMNNQSCESVVEEDSKSNANLKPSMPTFDDDDL